VPEPGAKTPEPESHIVERDLASGHERTLVSGRLGHLRPSPDGRYAVVRQNDPDGKWVAMRLVSLVDDRPATDLMRAEGNAALYFSFWSPDSRSVILQTPHNGQPTNWWVTLDGQPPKALSRFVGAAAVRPNGKTIAFAANDK
jgi:Tol biopolymer transport system component